MAKGLVALGLLVAVVGVATTAVATAQDDPPPPASTELVRGVSLYQGKSVRWWARRAVQARKDANARGLTIKRLRSQNRRLVRRLQAAVPFFPIGVWDALADRCESKGGRGQWHTYLTTGNGFYFRLQFHPGTWNGYRGEYPTVRYFLARRRPPSREMQIVVAERVLAKQGWGAWPDCSSRLGFR